MLPLAIEFFHVLPEVIVAKHQASAQVFTPTPFSQLPAEASVGQTVACLQDVCALPVNAI
jgi:hypothetical protein|tara:strand:- start:31 stop:210 length:180 start_codon:yes stop_codon:yes gene_type:complete